MEHLTLTIITAWNGITYTITEWYPWYELSDGRWLGGITLVPPPPDVFQPI
jgi:hypothetical protein